jgi:hypothetical protein
MKLTGEIETNAQYKGQHSRRAYIKETNKVVEISDIIL